LKDSPMARVLTRAQALQNRAFLRILRKTGNVRLACRELGLKYGTMQHRKRMHPAFALRWDAALVFAQAKFAERQSPKAKRPSATVAPFRTTGGEMTICGSQQCAARKLSRGTVREPANKIQNLLDCLAITPQAVARHVLEVAALSPTTVNVCWRVHVNVLADILCPFPQMLL